MCNKAVDNKTRKMCDKGVNTYPSTIKYVPKCFIAKEMCNKTHFLIHKAFRGRLYYCRMISIYS